MSKFLKKLFLKLLSLIKKNYKLILQYFFFVLISVIFWGFVCLNNDIQQDIILKLEVTDLPKNVTLIDDLPKTINVTIQDKGTNFLSYYLMPTTTVKIKFSEYCDSKKSHLSLNIDQIKEVVKQSIKKSAAVVNVLPNSIDVRYTDQPGKKVPIELIYDLQADYKHVIDEEGIKKSVDSVTIYADKKTLVDKNIVYTYMVQQHDLADTLRRDVSINPIDGVKIVPSTVKIMIPVEQVVLKSQIVSISPINVPTGMKLIIFPSTVKTSYLVPRSRLKNKDEISAVVDYSSINFNAKSKYLKVKFVSYPNFAKSLSLETDSVEYIIEKQ